MASVVTTVGLDEVATAGAPENGDPRGTGEGDEQPERQPDRDAQAGEQVEDQHAQQRGRRDREVSFVPAPDRQGIGSPTEPRRRRLRQYRMLRGDNPVDLPGQRRRRRRSSAGVNRLPAVSRRTNETSRSRLPRCWACWFSTCRLA